MKKKLLFFVFFCAITFAQKNESWTLVDNSDINFNEVSRKPNLPLQFSIFEFNYQAFQNQLRNVPNRYTFNGVSNVVVSLPLPNGELVDYRIVEASSFDEVLQARFPNIRSFAGNDIRNPSNVIRFSLSEESGISATIRSATDETTYIIDPFSMDYKKFIVYDRAFTSGSKGKFNCFTKDDVKQFGPDIEKTDNVILNNADDSVLRRFDLAQSCTAEYSNAFGATSAAQVNLVLAQYNATLTRVNAIYEQDFNVTMQIINQSTNVIYYNPATDPYSDGATGAGGAWNLELQNNLNANLTGVGTTLAANNAVYDIGHLFGASGGGGNAGCIGCVCVNPTANNQRQKGSGYTSPSAGLPQGDTFDIDYVAHEYGHQFGGNHTFTTSVEDNPVNMEPGSGVTIMAYAGITGANTDVANNSIGVFHAGTIQQITNNVKTKTCDTEFVIANAVPVPSAPATLTLPIGTAFKLVGTATDANSSDILSYSWEQVDDASGAGNLCSQSGTNPAGDADCIPVGSDTAGPNFRSFLPSNSGTRFFPRLVDHVRNGLTGNKWEVVPNVGRTMNFRLTVRDNKLGGGNNESVNTAVTFDATRGPFLITSQNTTGISYAPLSTQTITWSVNNTNLMAGAANVNIKLSTDGGLTYPITILSNTPNDGTQVVTIPDVDAPFCRILIEPTANNFYAINTQNFAIGFTVTQVCQDFTRTLTAGNAITTQTPLAYQNFAINIPLDAIITDVNVTSNITHARRNELVVAVNSPANTFVSLFNQGGCGNAIANLNGTFDSNSANPAACGATDNFGTMRPVGDLGVLNGENANGTWLFRVADVVATRNGTLNSFTFTICYTQITPTAGVCGTTTSTWNGTTWSNGVPNRNVAAVFAGNFNSTANLEACSVTINTGATVTFNAGHTLIVGGSVTANGTGSLILNNNAALRQIDGNAVNTGNIIVRRNSTGMVRLDYTAWSSPVANQQLQAFSPNTLPTRFYEYFYGGNTTPTAYQSVTATSNFARGKGYMIRTANNWPTTSTVYNGQFTGVPYNGDVSVSIARGFNLLGNPYASPINATKIMNDNPTMIGALYFWNNTVAASGGTYPQNNYSAYTLMGGTASVSGGQVPNGIIQVGQGFFVRGLEFGTMRFTNAHRENASASTQFFRTSEETTNNIETEKHRIWLSLNKENEKHNQVLFGYMEGATSGFDFGIDGSVPDDSKTMLYSVIDDKEYVIQGKGLPFDDSDEIALGLKATSSGTYSISLENVDGLFGSQNVYIKDNTTNTIHDIKQAPYVFTTQEGVDNNRFKVVFRNTLSNDTAVLDENVIVITQNEELKISASQEIATVDVFDVLGRNVYNNSNVKNKGLTISSIANRNQALFVKITFISGNTVTRKVIK
ncbi:reprolysin-like metallopeptidase [Flavobacterium difficile]|uniref:T9SS sorting signal type C domain-containing protein n=1 Tax=Flavobacterium difficile TaxID=2709659 RepID=A0ABX0I6A1_9FLAO|nr:zinc-dependent metalloprotease family protein [Flavobacterium difficile]NHM02662.1 T9SS sorting signal type C domain-containing protein [Flavobacterium difficile]